MEVLRVDLWTPCWVLILLGEVSDLGMATDHPPLKIKLDNNVGLLLQRRRVSFGLHLRDHAAR